MVSYEFGAMKDSTRYITKKDYDLIRNRFKKLGRSYEIGSIDRIKYLRLALIVYVMWGTGRRISEIVGDNRSNSKRFHGLRYKDIDFDSQLITFSILKKTPVKKKLKSGEEKSEDKLNREIKSKRIYEKQFAYDTKLFDTLKKWVPVLLKNESKESEIKNNNKLSDDEKEKELESYFSLQRIFPITRSHVNKYLKEVCNELKITLPGTKEYKDKFGKFHQVQTPITPHSFRHGFAVNFLKRNKNNPNALPELKKILQHSNIEVTTTYLTFDHEEQRELINNAMGSDEK